MLFALADRSIEVQPDLLACLADGLGCLYNPGSALSCHPLCADANLLA